MHAQPVKDILRLMDTRERERKGEMNSDREKNVFQCTSYFYLLHFLTAGKYRLFFGWPHVEKEKGIIISE